MHLYEVLKRPIVTEKSSSLQSERKYTFEVSLKANKYQVKSAVEKAFKVQVITVKMITVPGKLRRVGKRQVMTHPWKKAVVTLKADNKIEFFEGV